MAPAPDGADAHAHDEPAAGGSPERRLTRKKRLWREQGREQLEGFRLAPWAGRRRHDLLELLDRLNPTIAELSPAVEQEVEKCPEAQRLRTHPGVGPLTTWFETVKAPEKHLVWFEHSAHMPMTEEPGKFLLSLVRYARPIAEKAGDVAP